MNIVKMTANAYNTNGFRRYHIHTQVSDIQASENGSDPQNTGYIV